MIKHLSAEAAPAFNRQVMVLRDCTSPALRGRVSFESALAEPKLAFAVGPFVSYVIQIAEQCLFCLCKNHPLLVGNLRTNLASCLVFLSGNGHLSSKSLDVDVWQQFVFKVASLDGPRIKTTIMLRLLLAVRP